MKFRLRQFLYILFVFVFLAAIYFYCYPQLVYDFIEEHLPRGSIISEILIQSKDKQMHFFYMGGSSFMLNYLLKGKSLKKNNWSFLLGSSILIIISFLEEFRHYFDPNRNFEFLDVLSGTAGIILFGYLGAKLYQLLSK